MTDNGRIPESELATVAVDVQLTTATANAYRQLVAQAAHEHISIKPAAGIGSGYRDIDVQKVYWLADRGDVKAQAVTHHIPGGVPVAAPGYSSHGWGTRIDLLFDGSSVPNAVHLNLAKRFGFTREFGSADANHFEHDGKTAIHPPVQPPATQHITVQSGDNLSALAHAHGLSLSSIERLNPQIRDFNLIHPGDKIRVR